MSMGELVVPVACAVGVLICVLAAAARVGFGNWRVAWAAICSPIRARTAVHRIRSFGVGSGSRRRESVVGLAWPTHGGGFRFKVRVPAGVNIAVVDRASGVMATAIGYSITIVPIRRRTVWVLVSKDAVVNGWAGVGV